ncbi:MAG TPA: hypothetical protein VGP79_04905 [Bryobacteraceae bacterium]|jgi:hypothetical protein|nr:hypothetical protein [Bryobacteraceae bacterium]
MQAAPTIEQLDPQHFMTGAYLYKDVQAYAALGEHRTATEVDRKTSQWLRQQLEGFGFSARLEPFTVRQFFLERAELTLDGAAKIPCFPLWPPLATGATPRRARIVPSGPGADGDVRGAIALVKLPPGGALTATSPHAAMLMRLIEAGVVGIIGVSPSITGEPIALNSDRSNEPWSVPILLIGEAQEAAVRAARQAAIVIAGRDNPQAEAFEVIGTLRTTTVEGSKHFVVSTPSSGWFRCAGERGPGIAIWLALARWASHRETASRFTFVASAGHELHEQGMRHFLDRFAPQPAEVAAWLHLGAGVAAYDWAREGDQLRRLNRGYQSRRLLTNRREWGNLLTRTFVSVRDLQFDITDTPPGELAQLAARGYKAFGVVGAHPYHHTPGDTDRTSGPEILEPVGQALLRTLAALETL